MPHARVRACTRNSGGPNIDWLVSVWYGVVTITRGISNTATGSDSRFEAWRGLYSGSAPRRVRPGVGRPPLARAPLGTGERWHVM